MTYRGDVQAGSKLKAALWGGAAVLALVASRVSARVYSNAALTQYLYCAVSPTRRQRSELVPWRRGELSKELATWRHAAGLYWFRQ